MNQPRPRPEGENQKSEGTSLKGACLPIQTPEQRELIRLRGEILQYRDAFEPVVNAYVEASEAFYRSEKLVKDRTQNLDWRSRELKSMEADLRSHLADVRRGSTRLRRQLQEFMPKLAIIESLREDHSYVNQKSTSLVYQYEHLRTVVRSAQKINNLESIASLAGLRRTVDSTSPLVVNWPMVA